MTEQERLAAILETLKAPRYTVNEALGLLKVSRPTFYAAAKDGRIKLIKFGRRSFVTRLDLARALAGE